MRHLGDAHVSTMGTQTTHLRPRSLPAKEILFGPILLALTQAINSLYELVPEVRKPNNAQIFVI